MLGFDFLTPALRIYTVEAMQSSEIRRLGGLKGWITNSERGGGRPEAIKPVYKGEDNGIQGGVDVATLSMAESFSMEASKEA